MEQRASFVIEPRLLELLRCPVSGQRLALEQRADGAAWLVREDGRLAYPIEEGIPILLADRASRGENGEE